MKSLKTPIFFVPLDDGTVISPYFRWQNRNFKVFALLLLLLLNHLLLLVPSLASFAGG